MQRAERLAIIKESAKLLDMEELSDVDLTLGEFGFSTSVDADEFGSLYNYASAMLRDGRDEQLQELHAYLTGQMEQAPAGPLPWKQDGLRLFISHLAKHQAYVSSIAYYLEREGIASFVAHTSIDVSSEWMVEIEKALMSCDAMAVILHEGFHESQWCDQEVGFAIARRVPIIPLAIDVLPYGFLGKFQAMKAVGFQDSWIAGNIANRLVSLPATQSKMTEGTVSAFEHSGSYERTRELFGRLAQMPDITRPQLDRLAGASRDNDQISNANDRNGQLFPEIISDFIVSRGGPPSVSPF